MVLAAAAVPGTMEAQQAQQPQVVLALVTVEMRTVLQVTVHIIAVVAAVAAAVAATRTEATADPASSSFALQASTTTIGRSQHGSTPPVFKAAPSLVHTMTTGRPRTLDGPSESEQPTATCIQR